MTEANSNASANTSTQTNPAAKDLLPRKALGRGLAALMPTAATVSASTAAGLRQLAVERIHPNRSQPRKHFDETALEELAASIRAQGVLQPIVVRRDGEGYEIVAGERRWRAATRAGLHEIPALVKEFTDEDALTVALIENIQRQDLDPLEEAEAYHRLIREHTLTHDQVAEAVGKSRVTVTNALRLLKLPQEALSMLADGRLTAGHARALMMLGSEADVAKLAREVTTRKMSVRETERRARELQKVARAEGAQDAKGKGSKAGNGAEGERTPAVLNIEERLQRRLGTKVRLHQRAGKGRIEIFFHSLDALDALLDKLS